MVGYSVHLKNKKKWLETLLKSEFFVSCTEHEKRKKNDKNAFCIDCKQVVCRHCISTTSHRVHQLLQIRRYVYHNVVRLIDMQKYFDCSRVQLYTLNDAKVIFLNCRPQPKPVRNSSGCSCEICDRQLSDSNRYCSIACKISGTVDPTNGNSTPSLSFEISRRNLNSSNLELSEEQDQEQNQNEDEDEDADEDQNQNQNQNQDKSRKESSDSEMLKPKKHLNKRKGIPRRAPFF